jgi:uncharacterized protein YrrD
VAKLDLNIGTPVRCRDGECGRLHKVVVDPHTQRVTDLIVQKGLLLRKDRVLPIDVVDRATAEGVVLTIPSQDLPGYPEYKEARFTEAVSRAWSGGGSYSKDDVRCWQGSYLLACQNPVEPRVRKEVETGISSELAAIERGTRVINTYGTVGSVDHVLVDPETGEITHMVVRRGILPYYPIVPVAEIEGISEEAVTIRLDEKELDQLVQYRKREARDVEAEVRDRLGEAKIDLSEVQISVQEGILTLAGSVQSEEARRQAESVARSVDGVLAVEIKLQVG